MRRLHWLAIPVICGFLLASVLLWLTRTQAIQVVADVAGAHGGVVRYVSNRGSDAGNDCQNSPSPCETIRHVIQVAQAGDYIHVAGGIYTGTMYADDLAMGVTATVIITKDISSFLGGYSPDFSTRDIKTYETILNAAGSPGGHVAVLADTNVRFGGFTLTGGGGAYSPGNRFNYPGGAMRVFGGSPTISDNIIIHNQAYRRGGGIYVGRGASPSILNNQILSNTILTLDGDNNSDGAGIYIASGPTLIRGNEILSNTAQGKGAGIYVGWDVPTQIISNSIGYNRLLDPVNGQGAGIHTTGDDMQVVIRGNHIYANSIAGGFDGIGLYISSPAFIDRNRIEDNLSTGRQAALYVADVMVPMTITNNIIADNAATGVHSMHNQDIILLNNTIARNTVGGVRVLFPEAEPAGSASFTLLNNIVANNGECGVLIENYGHQTLDYNDVVGQRYQYCGFPNVQAHNLSRDPRFVNPSTGDFHLLAGSAAINHGDGSSAPLTDYDGTLRSQYYNVDIGAYEFTYLKVFLPILRKVPTTDIGPAGLH